MLIPYVLISSHYTVILHIILLTSGLLFSILTIDKITKSNNSLKLKIFSSIIISLLVCLSIVFAWLLGERSNIDGMGLGTIFIIIPSCIILLIISIITGLILSIKRSERRDYEENLNIYIKRYGIIFLILILLMFYNITMVEIAQSTTSKTLCKATISPKVESYLFNEQIKKDCLLRVLTEESSFGEISCNELTDLKDRTQCYNLVSVERNDVMICLHVFDAYNCSFAVRELEKQISEILKNPQHKDILYAITSTPRLSNAEIKYTPLLKNIVLNGNLDAKRAAMDVLLTWYDLFDKKDILRDELLPLVQNQSELSDYAIRINESLNAIILPTFQSNIPVPKT
jgi:hypothetical protein